MTKNTNMKMKISCPKMKLKGKNCRVDKRGYQYGKKGTRF